MVFQSTQVTDGTPPPSLVSTKPRRAPGHRPAAVTPLLEAQPAPFDEPPGHCGRGWVVSQGGSDAPLDVGPPPPLCITNSVLGWGVGGPEETLALACVLSLVPAGHPAMLPRVVGEQGHTKVLGGVCRGRGPWSSQCLVCGVLLVWVVLHRLQDLRPRPGVELWPLGSVSPVVTVDRQESLGVSRL